MYVHYDLKILWTLQMCFVYCIKHYICVKSYKRVEIDFLHDLNYFLFFVPLWKVYAFNYILIID